MLVLDIWYEFYIAYVNIIISGTSFHYDFSVKIGFVMQSIFQYLYNICTVFQKYMYLNLYHLKKQHMGKTVNIYLQILAPKQQD